jgi:flagellar basal-body rod protein FlgB
MSDDLTIRLIESSLAASALRSKVVANNIANLSTPGFRRSQVRFEELLGEALKTGRAKDLQHLAGEVFQPLDSPFNDAGSDVSLDQEVGELVKNSAMYKTYMRMLNRLYQQMEMAIIE